MGQPQSIANILSALMARRGYARVQSSMRHADAWRAAVGESAAEVTRIARLNRGVLEVIVNNSAMMQEFSFQKVALLKKLGTLLPDENIRDLRFRVGTIQ